jgi:iron complex transport system substrate-binding protein
MDEPSISKGVLAMAKMKTTMIIIALIVIFSSVGGIVYLQLFNSGTSEGPITIVDDSGRSVTVTNYPPERIVSIMPVCTEMACALNLEEKIVGVDDHSNYPPTILQKVEDGTLVNVGDPLDVNIEAIIGLNPDIVLSDHGEGQSQTVQRLEELGIPVVVLHPKNLDGIISDIQLMGEITGKNHEAEALANDLSQRIQAVRDTAQNLEKPRVYVEYYFNGGYWSVGAKSFITELISTAGGINVFGEIEDEYLSTSTEGVLQANPEIIIISQGQMSAACGLTPDVVKARTGWENTLALQNDKIYTINEDLMIRPGPRIVDGLEAIAAILHPEVFD